MSTSTPSPDRPPATQGLPEEGRLLGDRYRLEELLASGGMAQVWRGTDEVLRRQVAVKLLHPHLAADGSFVTRFRQEAVAAARLAHPGIVAIYDTCSEGGTEAIVMELVPGRTLRHRLDEHTPIDPWQAAGLAAQVAEALDAAHRAGLVHRDIKPANVLLAGDGRVKVADFGIAKAAEDADLTQPGLMVGTAKYVAPEQVEGKTVDARTDIYSLGIVLYEMLCGRAPFEGDGEAAVALARLQREPLRPRQVRPSVPRPLEDIVCRAMARDPAGRYESAADLRAALLAAGASPTGDVEAAVGATTVTAAPTIPPPPQPAAGTVPPPPPDGPSFRQTERSWLVPTVILVVIALALGVAGLLFGQSGAGDFIGGVRDAITGTEDPVQINLSDAQDFDPFGDGAESPSQVDAAIDHNPETAWTTESYQDRDITALKPGVGLILSAEQRGQLDELVLTSPTNDWSASFYVADRDPGTFEGWGDPVNTLEGIEAGNAVEVDLGGTNGGAVLIWITDQGDGSGGQEVTIQEAVLFGRPE